jgi:Zn finger protein HypA/HybF involved in hydrogenase expression
LTTTTYCDSCSCDDKVIYEVKRIETATMQYGAEYKISIDLKTKHLCIDCYNRIFNNGESYKCPTCGKEYLKYDNNNIRI